MNKTVYKYFVDFENLGLQKEDNMLVSSDPKICKLPKRKGIHLNRLSIAGTPVYLKNLYNHYDMNGVISSKLYNDVGVLNPPTLPIKNGEFYNTYSQDLYSIPDLVITQACDVPKLDPLLRKTRITTKWSIISNSSLKNYYLSFMTEKCFEELINLFMVDELVTQDDRHDQNFFFYKNPESDKYEGVFAIDMKGGLIVDIDNRDDFKTFLRTRTMTNTPIFSYDNKSHKERIKDIRLLIEKDKLSKSQVDLIRDTVSTDYPKLVKTLCEKYNQEEYLEDLYNPISMLWDYNYKELRDELNL